MCGIVGYTGSRQAAPILLDGLQRLEYRGYDSAGIAVNDGERIDIVKAMGRLAVLREKCDDGKTVSGCVGIGHTRWATHGKPSDVNSHPHVSENGRIAIVHNGIIENFAPLKEMLINRGRVFQSETDTEVAAQLIDFYYKGDILDAVARAVRELEGSYALGIVCSDDPETLVAVKSHAPLIVAYGEGENFFASDVTAVISHTKTVSYLDDDDIAVVCKDGIKFYTPFLDEIKKDKYIVDWDVSAADKCGYEHYMFKEIMEQPEAVSRTIAPYIKDGKADLSGYLNKDYIKELERIVIIACGSASHVGVIAKYNIEKLARIPVEVVLASEFRYCDPIVTDKTLVISISQSGETADTLEAQCEAKRLGATTLAIVNVEGSSIAKSADRVIYTKAGPEIAVATTKAYSTQLAVTVLLALYIADCRETISKSEYDTILTELEAVPENIRKILDDKASIQYLAYQHFNNEDLFFIGRNIDYALSLEGSLKLKEISYIHSEAYAAGELKHGTISLVIEGTLVIAVATYGRLVEKTLSNALEVKARGAHVMGITTERLKDKVASAADDMITIPDTHEVLLPSLAVLPLQLFAYYIAVYRGCDIDKPRNLAKSVTVE
ncbi:MAG: glutamine--fructose-6-phosphate transaminase (isomerizing) [Firmicutes bacterium HGW-Firmicutes-16]|nr:MAG: glutamine--fructose-6-phosphate transaminase (isomerizing) [Firmicutes bacterium HGW-Firmicutes-16]